MQLYAGFGTNRRLYTSRSVFVVEDEPRDRRRPALVTEAERVETDPRVFTRIHMHFVVKGRGLSEKKVERAIALSVEKYCSASAMLAKTAVITHDFEVIDPAERAAAPR